MKPRNFQLYPRTIYRRLEIFSLTLPVVKSKKKNQYMRDCMYDLT